MTRMTQSMAQFLFQFHRDKLALIMMGHLELYTDEINKEYFEWLETDEGKSYLKGGSNYKEEPNPEVGKGVATKIAEENALRFAQEKDAFVKRWLLCKGWDGKDMNQARELAKGYHIEEKWHQEDFGYTVTFTMCVNDEKEKDCPLIPVPEHGDLIDKDFLKQHLEACETNGRPLHRMELQERLDCVDDVPVVLERTT